MKVASVTVTATMSNAVGLVAGGVSGTWGYRRELGGQWHRLRWQIPASLIGAGLGASILHTHATLMPQYHKVDEIVAFSYLWSLLYWVVSFAQQEAPRHEFTPRMESFLLAVSGAARADRLALEEMRKSNK